MTATRYPPALTFQFKGQRCIIYNIFYSTKILCLSVTSNNGVYQLLWETWCVVANAQCQCYLESLKRKTKFTCRKGRISKGYSCPRTCYTLDQTILAFYSPRWNETHLLIELHINIKCMNKDKQHLCTALQSAKHSWVSLTFSVLFFPL